MTSARTKRLTLISLIFAAFAAAVALLLYAMQNDLNHYYSLQSVAEKAVPLEQPGIRVGGMVEEHSLTREGDSLTVRFRITDFQHPSLAVTYTGILPDLFREKQGVIARGTLGADGVFRADLREDGAAFGGINAAVCRRGGNHRADGQLARLCGLRLRAFFCRDELPLCGAGRRGLPALIILPGVIGERAEGCHGAHLQRVAAKAFFAHQ